MKELRGRRGLPFLCSSWRSSGLASTSAGEEEYDESLAGASLLASKLTSALRYAIWLLLGSILEEGGGSCLMDRCGV